MPEQHAPGGPDAGSGGRAAIGEALALQALLYVSDALPPEAAAEFEERLAEDQKTREALSLAVGFMQSCEGEEPLRPDPAYRVAVLRQVQPGGWWRRLWRRREYPGHPLLWSSVSAAGVALVFLLLGGVPRSDTPSVAAPPQVIVARQEAADEPDSPALSADESLAARIWADLPRGEHLFKSHQEMKRKQATPRLPKKDLPAAALH